MTQKTKRRFFLSVFSFVVVCIVIYWASIGTKEQQSSLVFETAKVEKATLGSTVTATGTIEAVTQVEVGTQVSGIIRKLYVDYNSLVKKGQIIAELDKTNLLSELSSANSNLTSAHVDLEYQRTNYARYKTLYAKGLISGNEFETAQLAFRQAESTYATRAEAVKKAQTNLSYATITSPIDGVILSRAVEEGQTVASSFNTPTLFTIAKDLTDMRVIAKVDEADIGQVKEGQRVDFTVDTYPDEIFTGNVTQVRNEAATDNNVVTYEVVISAANPDLKLKPGLTANVTFHTFERENVVSVPTKALRFTPVRETVGSNAEIIDCEGKQKLWIKEGNTFRAVPVKTGISNGTRTEISNGISEGSEVVVDVALREEAEELPTTDASSEQSPFAPGPPKSRKK